MLLAVRSTDSGRKEANFLETSGTKEKAAQWADVTSETLLTQGKVAAAADAGVASVARWRRMLGSFGGFPQVLLLPLVSACRSQHPSFPVLFL